MHVCARRTGCGDVMLGQGGVCGAGWGHLRTSYRVLGHG
jgi:hypothetical protein